MLRLTGQDRAAGDDVRAGDQAACCRIDGEDQDEDAVLCQVPAVPEHNIFHATLAGAIHEDRPGRHVLDDTGFFFSQLQDIPVLQLDGRVVHSLGHPPPQLEVTVLAVDGDHVHRAGQVQHQLQLFLIAVPGNVHVQVRGMDDVGALPEQVVDHAEDGVFVARDRGCRDDD